MMENTLNDINTNTIQIINNDNNNNNNNNNVKVLTIIEQRPNQIKNEILKISDTQKKVQTNQRIDWHIPYILNGELYEILTQDGENVTVKCCNCPPDRVYRGSIRSTGNFHMHIKRRHPYLLGRLHEMKVTAILERRDRFTKNRKITTPRYDPLQCGNNSIFKKSPGDNSNTNEDTQLPTTTNHLNYQHNLKIKEVFKRHQEAADRNFKELTTINKNSSVEQPLNYSKKEASQIIENGLNDIENETVPRKTKSLPEISIPKKQMTHIEDKTTKEKWPSIILSPISTCDTFIDSSDETNHPNAILQIKTETIINDEAIDLTKTPDTNGIPHIIEGISTLTTNNTSLSSTNCIDKWLEVDTTLRGIHNELHIRNDLERKRFKLEMAKFKFLHPTFNFSL